MIYKSESIDKLAEALSGLQGEMHDAYKASSGYGYNYADLATVFETIRPLLKKYGLSVTQPVGGSNNMIELNTILMHSSGQYISSIISVPVDLGNKKMNSLQAAGSTITYLRRYCVCSIVGIATTDDDGKAGGESMSSSHTEVKSKGSMPSQSAGQNIAQHYTTEQLDQLHHQLMVEVMNHRIPDATVQSWCAKAGVESINQLSAEYTLKALKFIKERRVNEKPATTDEILLDVLTGLATEKV